MRKQNRPLCIKAMCPKALAALLALAAVGSAATSASAQTTGWKITVEGSGTKNASPPFLPEGTTTFDPNWTKDGNASGSFSPSASADAAVGATASASTSGTITIVCTWLGAAKDEPSQIGLAVTSSASFSLLNYLGFTNQPPSGATGTASNGQNDNANYSDGDAGSGWSSSGTHLITQATNGQTTVRIPLSVSASGSYTSSSNDTAGPHVSVYASASAILDTRSVTVTRGIPAKLWNDPTLNKDRDEWVEADGTGHGNTTYSYSEIGASRTMPHPNPQNFTANFTPTIGTASPPGWGTKVVGSARGNILLAPAGSWNWTPSDYSDTYQSHSQVMPTGKMDIRDQQWIGGTTGTTPITITYNITDTDGAKGTGKYNLTVHDAIEDIAATPKLVLLNPRPVQAAVNKTSAGQALTFTATDSVAYSLKVGLSAELGKKIAELLPVVPKVSADFTVTGTTTTGFTDKADDLGVNQETWVEVCDQYNRYSGTCTQWGPSGFLGVGSFSNDYPYAIQPYAFQIHHPYINTTQGGGGGTGGTS